MAFLDRIKRGEFGFNGFILKMIAAITMLIDHVGYIFFPEYEILRIIGRISFPIFAFFVAEGFVHTRNVKKYALRIASFAMLSELPFDLAFKGTVDYGYQNVLFTFLIAIGAMYADKRYGRTTGFAAAFVAGIIAEFCATDYGMFGLILVMIFYWYHDRFGYKIAISTGYLGLLPLQMGIQRVAVLAMLPIAMYNGKKGISMKYFFYVFYPGHLALLYLIHIMVR